MIILTVHDVAIMAIMITSVSLSIYIFQHLLLVVFEQVTNLISVFIRWGYVPLHHKPKGLGYWQLLGGVY
nr:MAG TPA: hypothetical protein [Inoviridae sp.]